jgi:HTH-type transcriptional regulator/antitoxin HigA
MADCGVALVLLPHFKNTKINGATFWMDNKHKAVVALSLKGSYADIFWFSLFHEIAHLLLHDKREVFLEDDYDDPLLQKQEDEANCFARDFLIEPKAYQDFVMSGTFDKETIELFAKKCGVLPAIVVGRLMHEKLVRYDDVQFNYLRIKYKWAEK